MRYRKKEAMYGSNVGNSNIPYRKAAAYFINYLVIRVREYCKTRMAL